MVTHLHDLAGADPKESSDQPWLGSVPDELDKLTGQWERDVILPTTDLSDLMYKRCPTLFAIRLEYVAVELDHVHVRNP